MRQTDQYTFQSEPRAVSSRKKYRDPNETQFSGYQSVNIMYDRRVVRGNTYSQPLHAMTGEQDPAEMQRKQQARKRRQMQRTQREAEKPVSPEPVEGRQHTQVQTEVYLEEITDKVVEVEIDTQTDFFMDRPPSPLFVPQKTGVDAETQIMEGDLFDFDHEVEPILQVLVGKTLEQSLMEVMEEEELANLRALQAKYEQIRNAELAETQRMEAAERRRVEEKERRLQQERERKAKERAKKEKLAARRFAEQYLSNLQDSVFQSLTRDGFFYDTTAREVETEFMPWLTDQVVDRLQRIEVARALTDDMIGQAMERAFTTNHQHIEALQQKWAQEAEEQRKREALKKEREEARQRELAAMAKEEADTRAFLAWEAEEARRKEEEELAAQRAAEEAERLAAEEAEAAEAAAAAAENEDAEGGNDGDDADATDNGPADAADGDAA